MELRKFCGLEKGILKFSKSSLSLFYSFELKMRKDINTHQAYFPQIKFLLLFKN